MAIDFDHSTFLPEPPCTVKPASDWTGPEINAMIGSRPWFYDERDEMGWYPSRFKSGRIERTSVALRTRNKHFPDPSKTEQAKMMVDRTSPQLQADLDADPIRFIQSEFSRALIAETIINRELYNHENVDPAALTASNKRMVELADAMKTLPKQNEGARGRNQKSTAELIEDAQKTYDSTGTSDSMKLTEQTALNRAAGAFDEDE